MRNLRRYSITSAYSLDSNMNNFSPLSSVVPVSPDSFSPGNYAPTFEYTDNTNVQSEHYNGNDNGNNIPPITTRVDNGDSDKAVSLQDIDIKKDIIPIEIRDFAKIADEIANIYMGHMTYYSICLDLIALYVKSQKIIYVESKTYCERCLYFLMLPAIFISAVCTVISNGMKKTEIGPILVSALTGLNSFILAVVTYLKLDAKAEAHKTTSYQLDKLQNTCEFYAGRVYMIKDEKLKENVGKFIEDIESKIGEIKDSNQFIIPETIRERYSNIYTMNIFALMKSHKTMRVKHTQRLINICLQIEKISSGQILEPVETTHSSNVSPPPEQLGEPFENGGNAFNFDKATLMRMFRIGTIKGHANKKEDKDIYSLSMSKLLMERDALVNEIIEYRNMSIKMNEIYQQEIDEYYKKSKMRYFSFFAVNCLKT